MSEVLVNVIRGQKIEGCHYGDLVAVDWQGKILKEVGSGSRFTYWRSGAKPFQLLPLIERGGVEEFKLTNEEIALIASSHSGEDKHIEVLEGILKRISCKEEDLDCGFAAPLNAKTAEGVLRKGENYRKLQHNCSGKHTAMLALARLLGTPINDYIDQEHLIQRMMISTISQCAEIPEKEIKIAIDGCGVPVFGFGIKNMALAYAKLTVPEKAFSGVRAKAARIVLEAMVREPFYVAGTDRLDTILMEVTKGRVVAKLGAEAVYNVGIKEEGIGVCLKIDDGSVRAIDPVIVKILKDMDFLTRDEAKKLENHYRPLIRNHRGDVIGYLEPVFGYNS